MNPFGSRVAGVRRALRRMLKGPPESLLAQKIRRAGGRPEDFSKLLAMDYVSGMSVLRRVADGEEPTLEFLAPASPLPAALAPRITGEAASAAQESQRFYTGQLVQLLLVKWLVELPAEDLLHTVRIGGLERLREYQEAGRGAVLLGSHFGPARLVPYLLPRLGVNLAAIMPHDFGAMADVPLPERLEMITLVEEFGLRALAHARQQLTDGRALHSTGDGMRLAARDRCAFLDTDRPFPISQQMLGVQANCDCLPVFICADSMGSLTLEIGQPLEAGPEDKPAMSRAERMLDGYISALEKRWREDFGNVPLHSLQLYDKGWDKAAALSARLEGAS